MSSSLITDNKFENGSMLYIYWFKCLIKLNTSNVFKVLYLVQKGYQFFEIVNNLFLISLNITFVENC